MAFRGPKSTTQTGFNHDRNNRLIQKREEPMQGVQNAQKGTREDLLLLLPPPNDIWDQRLRELKQHEEEHGNYNVPLNCSKNRKLGRWVNTQPTHFALWERGRKSQLTRARIRQLNQIGFTWAHFKKSTLHLDENPK